MMLTYFELLNRTNIIITIINKLITTRKLKIMET